MFLVDWLTTLLRLLGLSSKKARIIILGALAVDICTCGHVFFLLTTRPCMTS